MGRRHQAGARPVMFRREPDLVPHIPRLRRLARALCRDRDVADDLVQDTLARALDRAGLFRGGNLAAWLATIMVNLFRSDRRRFARLPVLVELDTPGAGDIGAHGLVEAGADIRRALSTLGEEQRVAILLLALEGLSYKEIAEAQNVPIGTVMSRIARARENLRTALGDTDAKVKAWRR